ncbi:MAG: hypothetical protein A2X82_19925 [Geobacteraceae bacterium GWC2_55_20]|nr:MAG: hypothetical protein A2X82_19925 [Geobacteraceae bacterium GWC2_55_20]OGU20210.1 MAG: hypothetical protein A2X85_05565 [Geobacteraceae bacterium GWF2_54_21]HBA72933.1 hypothetical protein [Geobacter sp.]
MNRYIFLTAMILACFVQPAFGEEQLRADQLQSTGELSSSPATSFQQGGLNDKESRTEFVWELDPYYSEVSLHFPLTDDLIPEMSGTNEFEVYKKLLMDSLVPRFMLIEAAVFPMPLVGVALKEYQRDFYRGFNIGSGNLNLLETVTAGFQEPYAVSVFVGDMVSFVRPGEEKISSNKGYMGYMLSYSNQHIKRNTLIPDHNFEVEWKMKGERVFHEDKLSWSFRLGSKIHENQDISNTLYIGFRRSNLDFTADFLSFMNNGSIDFRWDFSAKDGRLLRQEYVIGKKFPIKDWHLALRLDVGVIWEDPAKYKGVLRDNDFQSVTAVLRPNIEF